MKGNAKLGAGPVHGIRHVARGRGSLPPRVGEEALDDAVLERMEGDDHQPPAGRQQALRCMQRLDQFLEFAVHMDAQRLEGARGGMDAVLAALAARALSTASHQIQRGGDRRFSCALATMARAMARERGSSPKV